MGKKPTGFGGIKGQPHARLKALPQFGEVDKKIRAGVSVEQIANWLYDEEKVYQHASKAALIRALYRYKDSIPANQLADSGLPPHKAKKLEELNKEINELDELTKLYHLQMNRIALATEQEETINFLTKGTRQEIEEARNLLLALAELKMKLGLLDEKPKQLNVSVTAQQVAEIPAERRHRLGLIAQKVLSSLQEELLPPGKEIQEAEYEIVE